MHFSRRLGVLAIAFTLIAGYFIGAPRVALGDAPGVTSTQILLGGTHPFSGPAAAYGTISQGINAYFAYVNDNGGVNGRKIVYKDVDDGYNPAQTVQLVKQLAEQDQVFAFFNTLGTAPNVAIQPYLNQNKIPQLFISTGATQFGLEGTKYPYTLLFNPDYQSEAQIFGKDLIAHNKNAKVAIIYQNDDFGQDYVTGFQRAIAGKGPTVVKTASYEVTDADVGSQMQALKASGADTLLIAATPKFAVQSMVIKAKLGWNPVTYLTDVSAAQFLMQAATKAGGAGATNGIVTAEYVLDPTNAGMAGAPGMKLYRQILSKYGGKADPNNAFVLYGMAAAYTMVDALKHAGKNPTRDSLMNAALHLNEKNPFFIDGVTLSTSPTDRFPIRQEQLGKYMNGLFVPYGFVIDARK
ncbi:MAG TPA: ABC transporter substrate-binding protein [Candidatus Acidoferrum sp.]|jgi:branched-chain amino acid transport system substrate-binding protein|nr:ABC transporter substrate-binding protein [Candidatus Acidoferrum sp.]